MFCAFYLSVVLIVHKILVDFVKKGETLAVLHGNDREKMTQARQRFLQAYSFSQNIVEKSPLIKGVITP